MSTPAASAWHPTVREQGWQRPVAVPASMDELHGSVAGEVVLPVRLAWSGVAGRSYNLADEHDRRMLYELVLTEGEIEDVRRYVNAAELVRLWSILWLSPHVRHAWQPRIAAASAA